MVCHDLPPYLAPILWLRPLGTFFVEGFSEWFSFSRCFSLLAPFQNWSGLPKMKTSWDISWEPKNGDIMSFPWFSMVFLHVPWLFQHYGGVRQTRRGGLVAFAMSSCALSNSPRRLAAPEKLSALSLKNWLKIWCPICSSLSSPVLCLWRHTPFSDPM